MHHGWSMIETSWHLSRSSCELDACSRCVAYVVVHYASLYTLTYTQHLALVSEFLRAGCLLPLCGLCCSTLCIIIHKNTHTHATGPAVILCVRKLGSPALLFAPQRVRISKHGAVCHRASKGDIYPTCAQSFPGTRSRLCQCVCVCQCV